MQITPNSFIVTNWEIDKNIFAGNKYLKIKPEFGAGHIIGAVKNNTIGQVPLIIIGIQWYYEMFYENKSILKYMVKDDYWASMTNRNNDNADLTKMIKTSFLKVKDEFDNRMKKFHTNFQFHELEEPHVENILQLLKGALKEKGF